MHLLWKCASAFFVALLSKADLYTVRDDVQKLVSKLTSCIVLNYTVFQYLNDTEK